MERIDTVALAAELARLEARRQESELGSADRARRTAMLDELGRRLAPGHARQLPGGAERRQHLRIPAPLEARFHVGEATVSCPANELSLGGLSLHGHLWIVEDQEVVLRNLKVGDRDYPMVVRSRLVWKRCPDDGRRPRGGLQFVELDAEGERQVRAVFDQLLLEYLHQLARGG